MVSDARKKHTELEMARRGSSLLMFLNFEDALLGGQQILAHRWDGERAGLYLMSEG